MADHRNRKHHPADRATPAERHARVVAARSRMKPTGGPHDIAGGPRASDRAQTLRRRAERRPT